jgi:hypothetical protein
VGPYQQYPSGLLWDGVLVATSGVLRLEVPLSVEPWYSLIPHLYQSILRRNYDVDGLNYWNGVDGQLFSYGLAFDGWYAMAQAFFTSAEYKAFARDDAAFLRDLYRTFFDREPDADGLAFWLQQMSSGMPREVVLATFMFSPEFVQLLNRVPIAMAPVVYPPENVVTVDLYRGLLGRVPDRDGFTFWASQFAASACSAGGVAAVADRIAAAFVASPEYQALKRTDHEFVGDLYNAFLRRGGDLPGVLFWIGQLQSGAQTRERVRAQFAASAEFAARTAPIAQFHGCAH